MSSKPRFRRPRLRRRRLSARSKLSIILITTTLTALFIMGFRSWQSSRTTLNNTIFRQLTSIRSIKADQVESYVESLHHHLLTLTEDDAIIAAMVRFNKSFRELDSEHIPPLWDIRLETHYDREFFPRLATTTAGRPEYVNYKPRGQAANYLQYYYLATNIEAEKADLDLARDGSSYSDYHAEYHPWLRNLTRQFGYEDLYLVDFESGNVIYSVQKKVDFATNLQSGPYSRSALAQIVQSIQNNPARQATQVIDFQLYQPLYNAPAAFLAAPIYNGPHVIGILVLQFPLAELNRITTNGQDWQAAGLGESGQIYLVGQDLRLRSQARELVEDPATYRQALLAAGLSTAAVDLILEQGTAVLRQTVQSDATNAALAGITDARIIENSQGERVLSAFAPLQLQGLSWGLIAEIDADEVFAPITTLTRNLFMDATILVVAVTFLSLMLAAFFMRPTTTLIEGTQEPENDSRELELLAQTSDEFGELARAIRHRLQTMSSQRNQLEAQNREYLSLLSRNLPDSVVERFRNGERRIVEQVTRATVLFVRVSDSADLMTNVEVETTATLINELDDAFHEAAARHDLMLIKLIGQQYVAVCGLVSQRLDHARRAVDLAISMRNIVNNFNLTHEGALAFHAGIDSGSVMGGIIGQHTFSYDLWGDALRVAQEVKNLAPVDDILVTEDVYQQVQSLYTFDALRQTVQQFGKPMAVWQLKESPDDRLPSASIATATDTGADDENFAREADEALADAVTDEEEALTEKAIQHD